jgi:hypothetical protein
MTATEAGIDLLFRLTDNVTPPPREDLPARSRLAAHAACEEHPRGGGPFDYLLLALAHHHLKHADAARACLTEGLRLTGLAEEGKLDDPTLPMPLFWIQRLELQILRREAETVINTHLGRAPNFRRRPFADQGP